MILGAGRTIKLEDTPKQQRKMGGERMRTKFSGMTTAERTIGAFRKKGQAIMCCHITRREFSCSKYQAI
jgi:hypothetical protein